MTNPAVDPLRDTFEEGVTAYRCPKHARLLEMLPQSDTDNMLQREHVRPAVLQ